MTNTQIMQIFNERQIRTAWDEIEEKWYFSIVDVVSILVDIDYQHARNYWKVLKNRLIKEGNETVTNCNQLKFMSSDGKMRNTDVADTEQLFRLIQAIPSSKAEPFKLWMARVASERLDEIQDPELAIDRAVFHYKNLGYSEAWINQRIRSIEVRKELTDEWKRTGVKNQQYATLTDIITREWSGFSTAAYKKYKGLKKESLRDNMTNLEMALNILAEASTTELSKNTNPKNIFENISVAHQGGGVAKVARKQLESQLGRSIISSQNAKSLKGEDPKKEIE